MEIKCVVTGYLDENCYVLSNNGKCLVVDPGDDYPDIKEAIGDNQVLGVLITHSHADHIGALRNFLTKRSIKIFKSSNIDDGMFFDIGDFHFQGFHTPGHSKDSVTFFFPEENIMFGSDSVLKSSIQWILGYDDDIVLYPGHYDSTTIGHERKNNPYVK